MITADLLTAIQLKNWYAVVALLITLITQLARKKQIPLLTWAWYKIPNGYRFLFPFTAGLATGFSDAALSGLPVKAALAQALAGALGIGTTSMGLAAALKESPLPWDGGKGGAKAPPAPAGSA